MWLPMAETVNLEKMYREILALKREVEFIKHHMIDNDALMTDEEAVHHERAVAEHKAGKTTKLSTLKKELNF
jgi:hypothetical protein